ncbi:MAG: LicD family protein [Dehalococcoidia bacterium]
MVTSSEAGEAAYEKSIKSPTPLDPAAAAERLKDVKRILDQLGVVFFLGSGTCLGAIRENRFIPWDDEMDTASVIGLHGLTEETIDRVIDAFTENGYYVHVDRSTRYVGISVVKSSIRADWTCHRIIGDSIYQYPAVKTPVRLFTQLKEIDFVGEKFLVPNPPEEYLRIKYGPDWKTPKGPGFEKDVVQKIPDADILNLSQRLGQFLTKHIVPWRAGRFRVLDREGEPVNGAEVVVVGVGRSRTNKQGYARFYVPDEYFYAVIVRYDDHEEVLYEEVLAPGGSYVYRPGPKITAAEHYKAGVRAMALSRE